MEDALEWAARPLVHHTIYPPAADRRARVNSNPNVFYFLSSGILLVVGFYFWDFLFPHWVHILQLLGDFCLCGFFSLHLSAMVQTWVNPNISADFIIVQFCILSFFEVINLKKDHLVYSFSNWCIINAIFIKSCFFNYFIQIAYCSCQQLFIFIIFCIVLKRKLSTTSWISIRKQFSVMFDVNSFSQGVYIDTILSL